MRVKKKVFRWNNRCSKGKPSRPSAFEIRGTLVTFGNRKRDPALFAKLEEIDSKERRHGWEGARLYVGPVVRS
jgi:hypothetical protein